MYYKWINNGALCIRLLEMAQSAGHPHPGRPRDRRLDDALLRAAREVFLERGFHHATMAEIARRAGAGTPALYRRWPTKLDLAIDIVLVDSLPEPILDTGSIRKDLTQFLRYRLGMWSTPTFHRIWLPVILEGASDKGVAERIRSTFLGYRKPLGARIRTAVAAGELRKDTDPDRLLNLLMGTVTMPLLFWQDLPSPSDAGRIVDRVLDGFKQDGDAMPRLGVVRRRRAGRRP
jgi:AcrR family transcriptional regulator